MNTIKKIIVIVIVMACLVWLVSLNAGSRPQNFEYGTTFSIPQAEILGLDWKEVYREMLEDLRPQKLRLSAYWNRVEPQNDNFDFADLDYQMDMAEESGAKVVLAVGRKLPRWPECHDPNWAKELDQDTFNNELLSYVETAVRRYQGHPALEIWQVENEPFLEFGECENYESSMLDKEIDVLKKFDPATPVIITDSGEINFWLKAGSRGEVFGTTLYRYVFSDVFKRYWQNFIPSWFYRVKGGVLRILEPGKKIVIIELQAEPWTTRGIVNTPVEEQFKTMSLEKFNNLISIGRATQYSPQYLWGVEWWYWMKHKQDHPEFWEAAKDLMKQ